ESPIPLPVLSRSINRLANAISRRTYALSESLGCLPSRVSTAFRCLTSRSSAVFAGPVVGTLEGLAAAAQVGLNPAAARRSGTHSIGNRVINVDSNRSGPAL